MGTLNSFFRSKGYKYYANELKLFKTNKLDITLICSIATMRKNIDYISGVLDKITTKINADDLKTQFNELRNNLESLAKIEISAKTRSEMSNLSVHGYIQ